MKCIRCGSDLLVFDASKQVPVHVDGWIAACGKCTRIVVAATKEQSIEAVNSLKEDDATIVSHTPGPWESYDDWYVRVKGGRGSIAAVGRPIAPLVCDDECRANARLIAASPEMFEIVQRLATVEWMSEAELSAVVKKCKAIIKKIDGPSAT